MSVVYGFGIEHELVMGFTDKNRKSRSMDVTSTSSKISSSPGYRSESAYWNETSKWSRTKLGPSPVIQSGDSTVAGMPGYGNEIQTHPEYSKNTKIKWIIEQLFKADSDLSKEVRGRYPYVIPNPFGSAIGFDKKSIGSFHITITFPYETNQISDIEYKNEYTNKVFNGLKVVRAIEPLFFSLLGGVDSMAVGNPKHAEGSSRQAYNAYANIGITKLNDTTKQRWSSNKHGNFGDNPSFVAEINKSCGGKGENDVADILPKTFPNTRGGRSVEFRFLDAFIAGNLYDVVKVLMLAMQHGADNVSGIQDSRDNTDWNKATQLIIEEGWNARLPKGYMKLIKDKLGLNIVVKDGRRADLVFQDVIDKLWDKNKNGEWIKVMFDEFSKPNVINLNRYNWDIQFRHRYLNDSNFESYINTLLGTLSKIDTSSSDGWIKVKIDGEKITFRDIILDDTQFGTDIGVEDTEDLLFLLERMKVVKIKTNTLGHIDSLKVLFSDPKDVMKKIDNLSTIEGVKETYYDTGTLRPEPTRPEPTRPEPTRPEPTRPEPTRPEPVTARRIRLTSSDAVIDMNNLSINQVSVERDSPLDYNIRELEEVFNSADFGVNVHTVPAKISYSRTSLVSFWIRSGNFVKVYLDSDIFGEDTRLSTLVGKLRQGFFSPRSVTASNTFVDMPFMDFIGRLERIASSQYEKGGDIISLDKSGMETLKRYDIRIMSLSRGEKYFIVDRKKAIVLKQRFKDNLNLINYIPYQKRIYVQKFGNEFRLMMDGKMIDVVRK